MENIHSNLTIIGIGSLGQEIIGRLADYESNLRKRYLLNGKAIDTDCLCLYSINDVDELGKIESRFLSWSVIVLIAETVSADLVEEIARKTSHSFLVGVTLKDAESKGLSSIVLVKSGEEAFLASKAFLDLLVVPTFIGVDFIDLRKVIEGNTLSFGLREVPGDYQNDNSPLFDQIGKSDGIVLVIYGNKDLSMAQVNEVVKNVYSLMKDKNKLLFSAFANGEGLRDKMKVICLTV